MGQPFQDDPHARRRHHINSNPQQHHARCPQDLPTSLSHTTGSQVEPALPAISVWAKSMPMDMGVWRMNWERCGRRMQWTNKTAFFQRDLGRAVWSLNWE